MIRITHSRTKDNFLVARILLEGLPLFQKTPALLDSGAYTIKSNVDQDIVEMVLARLSGDWRQTVTKQNVNQLKTLCDELGFCGFDDEIRAALNGLDPSVGIHPTVMNLDENVQKDLAKMKTRVDRHDILLAQLSGEVHGKASVADLQALWEEVLRLKDAQNTLNVPKVPSKAPADVSEFVYDPIRPLDGIIMHLTRQCRGNVHTERIVEVISSSAMNGGNFSPANIADFLSDTRFASMDKENSWIGYDFKGTSVALTGYSMKSVPSFFPKSWVLEVSNDISAGQWKVVDSHNNDSILSDLDVHNFQIRDPPPGGFRFVRLRQTGKNNGGNNGLALFSLEVFGTLHGV